MSALGWSHQRRRVERLDRFVRHQRGEDLRLRQRLRIRSRALFARLETMFLIGATGAVWTARLKAADPDGDKHPLLELFDAALVVRRWKWFVGRAARRGPRP